ncbi:hypothetical protein LSTR_LSTR011958 [Laodelphax striatellus]|uniref:Uncharacterized protein n=1 Tax=Laodelphax striatellus TaxID=195883 RepID=A0A482WY78_LAOST|nr:hypothetical protein LSTR_LSTR011958 [Laodelphax striatellus]
MTLIFLYLFLLLEVSKLCDTACSDCEMDFGDMKQAPNQRFSNGYYVVGSVEKVSDDDTSVTYNMLSRPQTKNTNQYQGDYNRALVVSGGYGADSSDNYAPTQHTDNRLWSKYQQEPEYAEKYQIRDRYHPSTFVNTYEHAGEVNLTPSASETHAVVEGLKPPSDTQNQHSTSFSHDDQHLASFSHDGQHTHQYSTHGEPVGDLYSYDSYHHHDYGGPYPYSGYQQPLPSITEPPQEERQQSTLFGYYYIGRKLWYIPLYFSIYFVLYVAALIIKSIGRHKIAFPQTLADTVNAGRGRLHETHLLLESAQNKFGKQAPTK